MPHRRPQRSPDRYWPKSRSASLLARGSALAVLLALTSCGGGGGGAPAASTGGGGGSGSGGGGTGNSCPGGPTSNSCTAATATAQNNSMCGTSNFSTAFYWEIGDQTGTLVSGQGNGTSVTANTMLATASASKWVYAAYVIQSKGGASNLSSTNDVPYLNFTSGYTYLGNFPPTNASCLDKTLTVNDCLSGTPSTPDPSTQGLFDYDSGHMEWHAANQMGLGADGIVKLASDIQAGLATGNSAFPNLNFEYSNLLLAGGVYTNAADYAMFLQQILSGGLLIKTALSTDPVCTWPKTVSVPSTVQPCTTYAVSSGTGTPIYTASSTAGHAEYWHYALGHWIEDDPTVGDGAFSSPGALGFYPWIDSTEKYYGIVAREDDSAETNGSFEGYKSAECGRAIRKAWLTGVEQ